MQWKPNVTVAAIARRDGKFLVVEEQAVEGVVFNQPAGHLERDETLQAAVRREVLEETGWDFEPEFLVGVYLYYSPAADLTYLRFCFGGSCTEHHPDRSLDEGIIRAAWMTRGELAGCADRHRSPLVLRCIDDFLAGKSYPLAVLDRVPSD